MILAILTLLAAAESSGPTSAQAIGWTILSLAGVAVAAERIQAFIRRTANGEEGVALRPSPLVVAAAAQFVPMDEHRRSEEVVARRIAALEAQVAEIRGEFARVRSEVHAVEINLMEAGEERASKIHERINLVLERVAELHGQAHEREKS